MEARSLDEGPVGGAVGLRVGLGSRRFGPSEET